MEFETLFARTPATLDEIAPLPQRLRDVGIVIDELPELARLTMSDYMMANLPRPMTEAEVLALLTSVW